MMNETEWNENKTHFSPSYISTDKIFFRTNGRKKNRIQTRAIGEQSARARPEKNVRSEQRRDSDERICCQKREIYLFVFSWFQVQQRRRHYRRSHRDILRPQSTGRNNKCGWRDGLPMAPSFPNIRPMTIITFDDIETKTSQSATSFQSMPATGC